MPRIIDKTKTKRTIEILNQTNKMLGDIKISSDEQLNALSESDRLTAERVNIILEEIKQDDYMHDFSIIYSSLMSRGTDAMFTLTVMTSIVLGKKLLPEEIIEYYFSTMSKKDIAMMLQGFEAFEQMSNSSDS